MRRRARAPALAALAACAAIGRPAMADAPADGPGAAAGSGSGSQAVPGAAAGGGSGSQAGPGGAILKLPLDAGAPEVRAAASPTVVQLGAHFTLYVTATFGEGVEVNLREPVELGPAFEVRRKLSEDRRVAGGRTTREWQIDVTPWELGDLQIAPIAVTFTASGRAAQVQTNAVPLKIIGELGDMVDDPRAMRGLAGPTGLTTRDWFWIWMATAAGAAVGVVIAALWVANRRKRRGRALVGGAIARPRRIDMTGERALERLLVIERSGVLDREGDRKLGYAEMVGVIRAYLGARYQITVHDLTSLELLGRLGGVAPREEVELVAVWLGSCDLVKYGGQRVTPADAGKALDDARALIVTTTPAAAQPRARTDAAGQEAA
ncbi:MAG TPA: BatD family protein [Kofleriaceae bacterium]|nr:BatD family protein [Kofleriaceae bacterium]